MLKDKKTFFERLSGAITIDEDEDSVNTNSF